MLFLVILGSRGSPNGFLGLEGEPMACCPGVDDAACVFTGRGGRAFDGFDLRPPRDSFADRDDLGLAGSSPGGAVLRKKSASSCVWLLAFGLTPWEVVSPISRWDGADKPLEQFLALVCNEEFRHYQLIHQDSSSPSPVPRPSHHPTEV